MTSKINVPQNIADKLLFHNRHICCICNKKRKHVQIHHIDKNTSNYDIENLAVLCLDCHSIVTGNEGLGRSYTIGEISLYKKSWERKCGELLKTIGNIEYENWEEDDYVTLTENHREKTTIKAHQHYPIEYKLLEDSEIKFSMNCNSPIDISLMNKDDYDEWLDSNELEYYDYFEHIYEIKHLYIIPENNLYNIVFINNNDFDIEVELQIKIWE